MSNNFHPGKRTVVRDCINRLLELIGQRRHPTPPFYNNEARDVPTLFTINRP